MIHVFEHGHVDCIAHVGGDLSVVNAARVSFDKRVDEMAAADEGLIKYLMKNKHGTPFEHNLFTFDIKAPIFVVREWQRHRIGSFNEMSGRYMPLYNEFYIPMNVRTRVGRPGHYTYVGADEVATNDVEVETKDLYVRAYAAYQRMLDDDIAPEVARVVLPVGIYTHMWWTVNARSLMHFLNLRLAATALWEIQQFAECCASMFGQHMPVTYAAWEANGREAP